MQFKVGLNRRQLIDRNGILLCPKGDQLQDRIRLSDIDKILNVSQNTYSQYETGVISLTAEVLIKLADYYNVSIDYLLDRTKNPTLQK